MHNTEDFATHSTIVRDAAEIDAKLHEIAEQIVGANHDIESLVLLGILSRGRPLADRLARRIGALAGATPPVGSLATTLYRDDFHTNAAPSKTKGRTHFDFSVDDRTVLLVDDVLAAGRTIRAAMEEVMDYGRPKRIQLACLLDRGGRELPIRADYLGWTMETDRSDWISVRLEELDLEDAVVLERRAGADGAGERQ